MPHLKIAIIGAGPAGCILARLLQHQQPSDPDTTITATIFEAESTPNFRSQGGTLDLHDETGLHAMKAAGLIEDIQKFARYDGEAMKICDKNLLCYLNMGGGAPGNTNGRPEIDRPQLRKLLYESLKPDTVRWGHKLISIDAYNTLRFANGHSEEGFDLIVGADGAWSKVRPLVSTATPIYSGIAGHAFLIHDAKNRHPELYKIVNRGSMFASSDGRSLIAQYMSDGSLSCATWSVRPKEWQDATGYDDLQDRQRVLETCQQEYADWSPRLQAFLQAADLQSLAPRDLFMLEIGHKWAHKRGVTLIGDAAHLATPFAGEGVNLALQDSEKLSSAILSCATTTAYEQDDVDLDHRVEQFEEDMFTRAKAMQEITWKMLTLQFLTPGAPRASIEKYVGAAVGYGMNPILKPFVQAVINVWYFVFKLIW